MGIIEALIDFQRKHGHSPSMEELGDAMGKERATISRALDLMAKDGMITFESSEADRVMPRTIMVKPTSVEHLSPTMTVGIVNQPGVQYLWVGPRGLLLTPEEQIGLLYYLQDRWRIDGNPMLDQEKLARIRDMHGDAEAIRREIMAPWPRNVYKDDYDNAE